jgi:hypothetical protein
MNETELHEGAKQPLHEFEADFPGARRRRLMLGVVAVFVVVVLAIWAVLFVGMNNRIHQLDRTTAAQAVQIQHLQTRLTVVDGSLGAAVACLQTGGSLQGLCTRLVK